MKHRRRIERRTAHDRWLVSYADFITLLFAFFVVMYSAAQLDMRRAGRLATAIQTAFQQHGSLPPQLAEHSGTDSPDSVDSIVGNPDASGLESLRVRISRTLSSEIANGDVSVRQTPDGMIISLREVGFFETGSAEIRQNSRAAFGRLANILRDSDRPLRIEGHTDNVPIHNSHFSSNWDLSVARATTAVRLLITQYSFDPQRLSAAGYAEFRPIASNDKPEGRALNRRVDIVVPHKTSPQ